MANLPNCILNIDQLNLRQINSVACGNIFHENRLLADDSHKISYLIFVEN